MSFSMEDILMQRPDSPPELSESRSSKSSSLHSSQFSDGEGIIADINHFEDITLDDEERAELEDIIHEPNFKPYGSNYIHDLRPSHRRPLSHRSYNMQRELTHTKVRPSFPPPRIGHIRQPTGDGSLDGLSTGASSPHLRRGFSSPVTSTLPHLKRTRSASPSVQPLSSNSALQITPGNRQRRGSWQSNKDRKTIKQLELECDEDDGDDLPDDILLENVPMSPRPMSERMRSQSQITLKPSKKEKIRPAGNGTPATPVAQGCLRSPINSKPSMVPRGISMGQFPINHTNFKQPRVKSWDAVLSELNSEARALTQALEAHADDQLDKPSTKRSVSAAPLNKRRVQSSIAELPPLRTKDLTIDPLPVSKEKEAVLSRTRPSWLPPKDPCEEKKHLKEYQRMMALSLEAEKKRELDKRNRENFKDDNASSRSRIWEEHVMPNWDAVMSTRKTRTRELWWRGIAPRSRGHVWEKAVGNELGLSTTSYEAALGRAKALEAKLAKGLGNEDDVRQGELFASVRQDIKSTFPELQIFLPQGPLCNSLIDVALAYLMYRVDVGYVKGLTTIIALLLLNMPTPARTFVTLCNILNRPLPHAFITQDPSAKCKYLNLAMTTLKAKIPTLSLHMNSPERPTIALSLQPDVYLDETFTSLFTRTLDLESMTRLWDVWVFEGDAILVRAAVALFTCTETRLYGCDTKEDVMAVLRHPDVGKLDTIADNERWMCAVRDAGRGVKSSTHQPPLSPASQSLALR